MPRPMPRPKIRPKTRCGFPGLLTLFLTLFLTLLLALSIMSSPLIAAENAEAHAARPRLIVLTDIGGDPDDQQSMIRLMLFANEFEIEGLIASASGTPGELKEAVTKPHLIREIVEAYGQVRGNLARHAEGHPEAGHLLDCIRSGNPQRGRRAIGEGHDTDGSRWIIQAVDKPDPRPVNITIWGGQTDLAQALWRVRADRGEAGLRKFIAKIRIYDIADQDGIAAWMWSEFPGLFYVLSKAPQGRDKREAAFRGMYLGGDESLVSREWMETHIRNGHGPLGALYPPRTWTAPNPHSATKEGDTPSWFHFLPTGLSDPERPDWGGWGGRFEKQDNGIWRDAQDTVGEETSVQATVWRWRPAFQAEFQARLDWCVSDDPKRANHPPLAALNGDTSRQVLSIEAKPGETLHFSAEDSRDPDGHKWTARWFVYEEPGTYRGELKLSDAEGLTTRLVAPAVTEPQTIHLILEVRDDGTPNLSRFRRAVITVTGD